MLYDLIIKSFNSKEKDIQEQVYNSKNYKSARQIINDNLSNIDLNDNITFEKLKEGTSYSSLEICALANDYNNQVGMYFVKETNSVIIKSTVEDNNRPYDDRWIKNEIVLKYYMQTEKEANVNTLSFSNKPNAAIFNSLMNGNLINIYTFINYKKGESFVYKGIYHPCGLIDDNRAFYLFKHGHDSEIPYDNIDTQFLMKLIKTGICPEVNCELVKRDSSLKIKNNNDSIIRLSKRNFIQQKKIDLEVSIRGEKMVMQYEKNKLIGCGLSDLAEKVENVTYYDNNLGYDIHSFEKDKNGQIIDVFIKVQSLVSTNKPLQLTKKEYDNLKNNSDKYKLYKIYNIYTDQPRLFIMNNINNINFETNNFIEKRI